MMMMVMMVDARAQRAEIGPNRRFFQFFTSDARELSLCCVMEASNGGGARRESDSRRKKEEA